MADTFTLSPASRNEIDLGAARVLRADHIVESGPFDRLAKTPFEKPF
jgi:hypothetical protein